MDLLLPLCLKSRARRGVASGSPKYLSIWIVKPEFKSLSSYLFKKTMYLVCQYIFTLLGVGISVLGSYCSISHSWGTVRI